MKKYLLALAIVLNVGNSSAFTIVAFGTSSTNCKNVDRPHSFTVQLENMLRADGVDATVLNYGVNGDRPIFMVNRITTIPADTSIVIFEPGPNESNPRFSIPYAEKVLAYLQNKSIPTIFASQPVRIISKADAQVIAEKYGAYYYGSFGQNIPNDDSKYRQFDGPYGGHMTGLGCTKVAEQMKPIVEQVIKEKNIK